MPRPKNQSSPSYQWDVRITPTDGNRIEFHPTYEDFEVFVSCEEGGTNDLRLHYHLYVVSNRSETYLRKMWATLGRATPESKGNAVFRMAKAHDKTIGYVVKGGNVVCRHGWTDIFLDEMLKASNDYRKGLQTERKQKQRAKESFLLTAVQNVREILQDKSKYSHIDYTLPREIMSLLLQQYVANDMRLPNRSSLETAVMTLMYPLSPELVERWYNRSFEFLSPY